MKALSLSIAVLILSACSGGAPFQPYQNYLDQRDLKPPAPESFQHCHGYGCKHVSEINLSKKQWRKISHVFKPLSKNAKKERQRIAKAITLFENYAGAQAGTGDDHWGTFQKTGDFQHDCVDESINTTIYLATLEQKKLLKFHTVGAPQSRVPFGRWPHQAAVIQETETAALFVVDSWFHDNGFAPEILLLSEWRTGWNPEKHLMNNKPVEDINKD